MEHLRQLARTVSDAELLGEQGTIRIHCEFCQQEYRFDVAAVDAMFSAPAPSVTH